MMNKLKTKLFGQRKRAATSGETIQKLRTMEEMLAKKQDFLESKITEELLIAKKNGVRNKRLAIQALKRKHRYQKQLQQIDGTLSTIEMQREALEMAQSNTAVLKTMSDAAKALKTAHEHLQVDQVHEMMDDIAEQHDIASEINDAISCPVSFQKDIDNEELEKELELLEQEELDKELLSVELSPEPPNFSDSSTSRAKDDDKESKSTSTKSKGKSATRDETEEEEELKELIQWGIS